MKKLFILISALFFSIISSAQSRRDPNAAEKVAINKAVNIIVPLIDGFQNSDWQIQNGGAYAPEDYSVQINPNIPINTAPFKDWHFTIRHGSDYYNKNIKAYTDKMNNGSIDFSDPKAVEQFQKEGSKIQMNLYVEVHVNDIEIPVKPIKNSTADLKIPGCYFSYKQPAGKLIGTDNNTPDSYVLVFGNWSTAKLRPSFDDYGFKFIHPKETPYIENIVIIISGNNDRIKELFKTIDWEKVNDGLTK